MVTVASCPDSGRYNRCSHADLQQPVRAGSNLCRTSVAWPPTFRQRLSLAHQNLHACPMLTRDRLPYLVTARRSLQPGQQKPVRPLRLRATGQPETYGFCPVSRWRAGPGARNRGRRPNDALPEVDRLAADWPIRAWRRGAGPPVLGRLLLERIDADASEPGA